MKEKLDFKKREGKNFTTEPKLRRITWHRLQTVRTRVHVLREYFYPRADVLYSAVVQKMTTSMGLVDRTTHLAYLGRPKTTKEQKIDQTVRYLKAGTTIHKRHYFKQKLPARKGYIERFEVGYPYFDKDGSLWIHWNHARQLELPIESLHEAVNPPTQHKKSD